MFIILYFYFVTVHEICLRWLCPVMFMALVQVLVMEIGRYGKYLLFKISFLHIHCRSKRYRDRKKMKKETKRKLSASARKRRQREKEKQIVSTRKFFRIKRKEHKEHGTFPEKKY